MKTNFKKFIVSRLNKGASAVEYGLIVGLIAVALVVVLGSLGGGLENLFSNITASVSGAGGN